MGQVATRNLFNLLEDAPSMFDLEWPTPTMRVEEYTHDGVLTVKAEIPGIDPNKDVKISISDGKLRIQAERREEMEQKSKNSYRSEFKYGTFLRDIALPLGTKRSDIKAHYKDGLLTVTVPIGKPGEAESFIPISMG